MRSYGCEALVDGTVFNLVMNLFYVYFVFV